MGADSASAKLYVAAEHRYVQHATLCLVTKRVFDIVVATLSEEELRRAIAERELTHALALTALARVLDLRRPEQSRA